MGAAKPFSILGSWSFAGTEAFTIVRCRAHTRVRFLGIALSYMQTAGRDRILIRIFILLRSGGIISGTGRDKGNDLRLAHAPNSRSPSRMIEYLSNLGSENSRSERLLQEPDSGIE